MNWRRRLIWVWDDIIKHRDVFGQLQILQEFEQLSIQDRLTIQTQRLTALLDHAAARVPHYHAILQETGVSVDGQIDVTRFERLPLLDKDTLRERREQLKSDDFSERKPYENASGGSTGQPVSLFQDADFYNVAAATTWLQYKKTGLHIGHPYMKLWGSARDVMEQSAGLRGRGYSWLQNLTVLNCFSMTAHDMERYVDTIRRKKPVLLVAYVDAVYELAKFINTHQFSGTHVPAVITSAGTLYDHMKSEIERAFECSVYNRYGTREVGNIALWDPAVDGLLVNTYANLIEVVDQDGKSCEPGAEGEILITNLANYAMPLIRYRVGDLGVVGQAADVGVQSVYVLNAVTGRYNQAFYRKDGGFVSPLFFAHFLGVVHNSGWVKRTQVVQEDYDRIVIKIIPNRTPDNEEITVIENIIKKVMGVDCDVILDFVDDIPPLPSGKVQYAISHVDPPR